MKPRLLSTVSLEWTLCTAYIARFISLSTSPETTNSCKWCNIQEALAEQVTQTMLDKAKQLFPTNQLALFHFKKTGITDSSEQHKQLSAALCVYGTDRKEPGWDEWWWQA